MRKMLRAGTSKTEIGGEEEAAGGDFGFFSSFTKRLLFVPRVLADMATENNFRNKLALK
jgi:hypothetical protein